MEQTTPTNPEEVSFYNYFLIKFPYEKVGPTNPSKRKSFEVANGNRYQNTPNISANPKQLKSVFSRSYPMYEGRDQKDGYEFMMFLLEALSNDLKTSYGPQEYRIINFDTRRSIGENVSLYLFEPETYEIREGNSWTTLKKEKNR